MGRNGSTPATLGKRRIGWPEEWWRRAACIALLVLIPVMLLDLLFPPPLSRLKNTSAVITDRRGAVLRVFPVDDGKWRIRADLDRIDPDFIKALLAYEDKRFHSHLGVDFLAMGRAAASFASAGRIVSGGSTITMQTARLLEPRARTIGAKIIESVRAYQLEHRFSKDEILELYLTLAPYGGNLEGVRAASFAYFGREPDNLSPDQIAMLIALPQSPEARRPDLRPGNAILARKPAFVLVDELAHTNAPGSRHLKRYQDVTELLEAGIDVYTTVNVQHFESRADAVREITRITVHETVPDTILDLANEIELIDLSPDDLRRRLAEGKVYTVERVETASNNFFRVGNLTALREMALRLTAEHVDHQLQDYMQVKRIAGPWKSGERLMVAISPSPFSERLIRWTRRMAYNLEAPWIAVYIDRSASLTPDAKAQLERNLESARELGGEVVIAAGENITDVLIRTARQRNVTQIVIGKPTHTRFQMWLRGGSLVDHMIRASGDIDVYVVTGDETVGDTRPAFTLPQPTIHSNLRQYLLALSIIAIMTAIDLLIYNQIPWIGYQVVGLTELMAVLLIAAYIGRGPAILAAAISALSWVTTQGSFFPSFWQIETPNLSAMRIGSPSKD